MRGLNIVLSSTTYPPDATGIAPYSSDIAEHLAESGHKVRVVTSLPHYPSWEIDRAYRGFRRRFERRAGVDVHRLWLYVPRKQSAARRALYEGSFLAHAFVTEHAQPHADLVLSTAPNIGNAVLASWWARRARAPHVMFLQDLSGSGAVEAGIKGGVIVARLVTRVEAAIARRADMVAVSSESFQSALEREGVSPDRMALFPNWSRLAKAHTSRDLVRRRLGWNPDEVIVLHAGNMGMKQGLEWIADYALEAARSAPALRFVLMGDGSQRAMLESRTPEIANVGLIDPVPEGDLPDVLAAADVLFVHERPSLNEMSIPSKLTAYFSIGRPVVAAVTSGGITAREVERSGGGIVTQPGNPPEVVRALMHVTTEPGLADALSATGRAYAATHYSRDTAMQRLDSLLDQVLGRRG
jgi:colanic acid biosynthesis glycosyl transferase WcaI